MSGSDRPGAGPVTRVDHETEEPDPGGSAEWLAHDQVIDRYQVLECLGVGGMGVIYSAWDPQLERKLAIKLVRTRNPGASSNRSRARLMREARALARLRHPNVVAVHDVGTHDGRIFVAMEFIEGETLHRWLLRSPPASTERLLDVFLQVGRGLAAAHRAGFVHRDVKPENVMIGEDKRVLILDFGIARETFGSESDVLEDGEPAPLDTQPGELGELSELSDDLDVPAERLLDSQSGPLTRAGAVIGTPAYMSPEQHRGQRVDARSDQFSFCVAMWEALNGEKPFGEGSRSKLLARMRVAQLRAFRNAKVPRRVVSTLRRGLSWHPGDRFRTMEQLLEQLNPRRNRLFEQRRLWHGVGVGGVVGLLVGAGIAATLSATLFSNEADPSAELGSCAGASEAMAELWPVAGARLQTQLASAGDWQQTRAQLDAWTARWSQARTQACEDHFEARRDSALRHDARVACLDAQLERFGSLLELLATAEARTLVNAGSAVLALPAPEQCAEPELPPAAASTPAQRELARAIEALELRVQLGSAPTQLDDPARLYASARELDDISLATRAARLEVMMLGERGQLAQASERALEAAHAAAGAGEPSAQAELLLLAARYLGRRGRDEEAGHWLALAAELLERGSPPRTQLLLEVRAQLEVDAGRPHRARQLLLEARAELELAGPAAPLEHARLLHALAKLELELGRASEALALLREAGTLRAQALAKQHPARVELHIDSGRAHLQLRDEQAARAEIEGGLALVEERESSDQHARLEGLMATLDARAGRCDSAWLGFERALALARTDASNTLVLAELLEAQAAACSSSHPDAAALARRAVELREAIYGPHHHALARPLLAEALAHLAARRLEAAEGCIERAAGLLAEQPGDTRHLLALTRGLAHQARGEDEAARAQLEAAAAALGPNSEYLPRIREALATLAPP